MKQVLLIVATVLVWSWIAYQATGAFDPIPCGSDAECHALNPGLCPDDQPYCF